MVFRQSPLAAAPSAARTSARALTAIVAAATCLAVPAITASAAPEQPGAPKAAQQLVSNPTKVTTPALAARATLSADHLEPGPPSGAKVTPANGRIGPFEGQVIPGFSAVAKGPKGSFWGLPDNGFGAKTNSADFLLRIYQVSPDWETATGGAGKIRVQNRIQLSDPRKVIGFPIERENTTDRLLTGADLDIESLQVGKDGSFWIGDEFGPFVLHFDAQGRLISAPVAPPKVASPQNPHLGAATATLPASGGFEAMAASSNGHYLYPITEKALTAQTDRRARLISELDTRTNRFTGRTWNYEVDTDANLVGDAQVIRGNTLQILERDDFDGARAVTKRVYQVDLSRTEADGNLAKTLVVDLLKLANPGLIGRGDGWGTGRQFSFGLRSVETILPLGRGKVLLASDNNYPGDSARRPGRPDDTELIVVDLQATSPAPAQHRAPVIGHRGASGYRPEHTLAAYELAIQQCADVIEPDVVMTKDGVPVVRHEPEITGTTDVATRPEFADRKRTKTLDGTKLTGWFVEDFTLAEVRTLRAVERLPAVRPQNVPFNGIYPIPTLAEVLDLARRSRTCDGRQVGVAPELKHSTYSKAAGLPLEGAVVRELQAAGLNRKNAPVTLQSFETTNLRELNRTTPVRLSQLVDCSGAPYDLVAKKDPRTYQDLITARGLREIATYADAVSFCKDLMIPRTKDGRLAEPTSVIRDAKRADLAVIGWTFRVENQFLPLEYRSSTDPNAPGDLEEEIDAFLDAGMDEIFTDNPDRGVAAVTRP